MVFTTLLCLDQAVFRLEVFSIVLSVCHYTLWCSLLYFVLIKLSLDWRYLVLCCLFVITMVFTTSFCLDQAVFRLEVFSIVLSVCHYNGVHYFTLS